MAMESIYPEFALNGSNNECAWTDTAFCPLHEVSTREVTLLDWIKRNFPLGIFQMAHKYAISIPDIGILRVTL